jgi:chromosome segregation protein
MYLKRLILKGFKSFADSTAIELEPGITCVVGPNGSGKSNVVDAIAWVLGAQGPKTVRSSKMEDVIFAGNSQRPALGRAEVTLQIDNSAGLLPIDFSEISIKRVLWKSGESEYFLNDEACRLLDIQELLSDIGIGKSQHVIVSQGQIDQILNLKPEERRLIIEEASGIIKYRKRRERSERRLEQSYENLDRLKDSLREIKRQITPLERQAHDAQKYELLNQELHKILLYLSGTKLKTLLDKKQELTDNLGLMSIQIESIKNELAHLGEKAKALADAGATQRELDFTDSLGLVMSLEQKAIGLANVIEERLQREKLNLERELNSQVLSSLEAESAQLKKELNSLDSQLVDQEKTKSDDIVEIEVKLNDLEFLKKDHIEKKNQISNELAVSRKTLEDLREKAALENHKAHLLFARKEVLSEILGLNFEGEVVGSKGRLSDLIEIEAGFETPVWELCRNMLVSHVFEQSDALLSAVEYAFKNNTSASLIRINENSGNFIEIEGLIALRKMVRAKGNDAFVDQLLDAIFYDFYFSDKSPDKTAEISLRFPRITIVTKDGHIFGEKIWKVTVPLAEPVSMSYLEDLSLEYENAKKRAEQVEYEVKVEEEKYNRITASQEHAVSSLIGLQDTINSLKAKLAEKRHELDYEKKAKQLSIEDKRQYLTQKLIQVETRLKEFESEREDVRIKRESFESRIALYSRFKEITSYLRASSGRIANTLDALRKEQKIKSSQALESLNQIRKQIESKESELEDLQSERQSREVELAEITVRVESFEEQIKNELKESRESALAATWDSERDPEERKKELEKELELMGPINPLAIKELNELKDRLEFFETQIQDVKTAQKDLNNLIRDIDKEIADTFYNSFNEISKNYKQLIEILFPNGSGELLLTDPENLLETGIDIEAKPPGRTIKKMSLLSGGERSLVALAFLFAIFKSKPSFFLVLDEVEAALDDINLSRFLNLLIEFKKQTQVIVITHQKRTMQVSDALWGVSMKPGGVTKVVSQKISQTSQLA